MNKKNRTGAYMPDQNTITLQTITYQHIKNIKNTCIFWKY